MYEIRGSASAGGANNIIPLLDPLTIISTIEIWVIWVIILCEDKKITNLCVVRGFTALLKV